MTGSVPARLTAALADRYRLERELGEGGMATVYQAHDLRHGRDVAIKVLHPDLGAALGGERFLSEIRTTARLQHPHILPLLDSGEADGLLYYVMPLVTGETLRARLEREQQLPIDQAVQVAREVADALGHAHGLGIIHRDIKPENILLQGGHALVADFGIALAVQQAGGHRMTQTGLSLGTPQYMSPEQAMGERKVDARSDVYALGAVTYEMLSGDPPFTGSSVQAIVAKIMAEPPTPLHTLRGTVPAHVEQAVHTALAKLPADRFATAAEFAQALVSGRSPEPVRRAAPPKAVVAMALVTAASLAFAAWSWLRPVPGASPSRYVVDLESYFDETQDSPEFSPDGTTLAYGTLTNDLVLRHEASRELTVVPGLKDAWSPFYSPDGKSIAYVAGFPGDLKVVDLGTMAVRTLVPDSAVAYGGSWSDDGWIYYTAELGAALWRVRADGGEPELVRRADPAASELVFRFPHALPGGAALLLTRWQRDAPPQVVHLDLRTGTMRVLSHGFRAWFLASGHLVLVRGDGILSAARFSAKKGDLEGPLVDMERGIRQVIGGTPIIAVSRTGSLAYGRKAAPARLVRVSRSGETSVVDPALTGQFLSVSLSPDGSQAAIAALTDWRYEIWVKSLDTGPFSRVASAGTYAYRQFWSPDSRAVGFVSDVAGVPRIYATPADGSGEIRSLTTAGPSVDEGFWTLDGRWLVIRTGSGAGRDIRGVRQGDSTAVPLVATEAEEYAPSVSPDGRWLVYGSSGSGRDEIFVRPFPAVGGRRVQVSLAGGTEPVWAHSGREVFYRDPFGNLVAVAFGPGPDLRVQSRRVLFSTARFLEDSRTSSYAVAPDGQSFYFIERGEAASDGIVIVKHWTRELEAKVN